MNKQHAEAWDQVARYAETQGADLVREGHRFFYRWGTSQTEVAVWAEENAPRYGVRVGTTSARTWNLDSARVLIEALPGVVLPHGHDTAG